ncbi:MAG: hypothetical protein FD123_3816 [Bacteroidetes bacterium]|nr:MAG: hypothetical protein FD123_3816 [Bacteroidota bacterium]
MPTNISTITINAPAPKVWDILTKPEFVKQWQFGSDLVTDWNTGSEIRFRAEWEGNVFEQWGKVLDVQTHKLIKYSLFAPRPGLEDRPENYFVMTYVLTAADGKTKLEIIQEDNRPGAKQEEPQGEENPVLQSLKKLAEAD